MATRRTMPIPIPGDELARMQDSLSPHYGSELWDRDGQRILVIRTPGLDPDIVNDLESAIEYISPGDVANLDACLLVGEKTSTAVSVGPIQKLMDQRVQRDKQIAGHLRSQIPGRVGAILYRAPDDPRRLGRLGLRIPHAHSRDIEDEDLDHIADTVGPKLSTPQYGNIQAVYLIADEDDVRLEADLFLQELHNRWEDEARRQRAAEEDAKLKAEEEARRKIEREEIMGVLRSRYPSSPPSRPSLSSGSSTSYASQDNYRHSYTTRQEAPTTPRRELPASSSYTATRSASRDRSALDATLADVRARVESSRSPTYKENRDSYSSTRETVGGATTTTVRSSSSSSSSTDLRAVRQLLQSAGYEIMENPSVPGHTIDLAAEREAEHPRRVIVRLVPNVDESTARGMMQSCSTLETDLGVLVAPHAEAQARELLIATKVKWVSPDNLGALGL